MAPNPKFKNDDKVINTSVIESTRDRIQLLSKIRAINPSMSQAEIFTRGLLDFLERRPFFKPGTMTNFSVADANPFIFTRPEAHWRWVNMKFDSDTKQWKGDRENNVPWTSFNPRIVTLSIGGEELSAARIYARMLEIMRLCKFAERAGTTGRSLFTHSAILWMTGPEGLYPPSITSETTVLPRPLIVTLADYPWVEPFPPRPPPPSRAKVKTPA